MKLIFMAFFAISTVRQEKTTTTTTSTTTTSTTTNTTSTTTTTTSTTTTVLKEDEQYQYEVDLHDEMDLTRQALQSIRGNLYSGHHSI